MDLRLQLRFAIFDLDYYKPRISSFIFLRVDLETHIQAFSDGARKEKCTYIPNLFIRNFSEPTVEAKERFRSALTAWQIEPLKKTSGHQSEMQDRDWP